jgi:glucosylceramidase
MMAARMSIAPGRGRIAVFAAALAAALCAPAPALAGDPVDVYLTGNDGRTHLTRQPDLRFSSSAAHASVTVSVDPSRQYQPVNGFGGAFTDSSLYLLAQLSETQRQAVLKRLLVADPGTGSAGLSVMRVPMGSSDYTASGMYSYDDNGGVTDPAMSRFSITHDQAYVLPVLREALAIDPRLQIIASPWSPPSWMKTNDSMVGVSPTGGPGVLKPSYYEAFAQYFVRFIEAYRAAGVRIWAITPQNEPGQPAADYPGMFMTASEEALFVHDFLAPALRAAGLGTRIYGYDYIWVGSEPYAASLLSADRRDLAGIAYHCYFGAPESMSAIHRAFPGADLIQDECSTGISELSPIQVLVRSLANWASLTLMWNVALDPSGGPKIGSGCLNCIGMVTIDPASGRVSYNGAFWEFAQAGAFVSAGAHRIAASASPAQPKCTASPVCGLEYSALSDPNGDQIVIATNSGTQPVTFAVKRRDGRQIAYTLPGQTTPMGTDNSRDASVVTFVWGPGVTS